MCAVLVSGMRSEPDSDVVKQSGLGFLRLFDEEKLQIASFIRSSGGKDWFYYQLHQVSEAAQEVLHTFDGQKYE